ncbi:hypothetical protein IC620_09335 [Hazenella sp. IB182357]|uniref:Uncharacterized protein n=1 Tax=Polycladospora coralii TaxID=2771432 RepID=A0A926RXI8_9BACL|nr:hypothetical protein [Polycladospora coralii]MBD1372556.1 hypothetical protein [Polycladospora coralii]MBS7531321.1 hypothetical protein [Polycladospora coralii]
MMNQYDLFQVGPIGPLSPVVPYFGPYGSFGVVVNPLGPIQLAPSFSFNFTDRLNWIAPPTHWRYYEPYDPLDF